MANPLGPLLKAGGAAVGTITSLGESRRQRNWSRENYQNRYQWTMEDMKKAGLNPILAAGMGLGGGGTPSGASANIPDLGGVGDLAEEAITGGKKRDKITSEQTLMGKLGEKHTADAAKSRSDIEVNEQSKRLIAAQAGAADATRNRTNTQNLIEAYGITNAMLSSHIAGKESTEMARTAAEWTPMINAVSGIAGAWGFGRFLSRSPNAATPAPRNSPRYDPNWRPRNQFRVPKSHERKGSSRRELDTKFMNKQQKRDYFEEHYTP